MKVIDTGNDLAGSLLISSPSLDSSVFGDSVIFMCSHDQDGSMGLVINQPLRERDFISMMADLEIETRNADMIVHNGGPVETGRGFVLHDQSFITDSSLLFGDSFALTTTLDILELMAQGDGPTTCLFALGYAGWSAGQLDQELLEDSWFVSEATRDIVFETDDDLKRFKALASLGVDPSQLSHFAGNA